jgi:hypothetical protein
VAHHDHAGHAIEISLRTKRITAAVSTVLAVAILIGLFVIGFGTDVRSKVEGVLVEKVYEARVTKARIGPCSGTTAADACVMRSRISSSAWSSEIVVQPCRAHDDAPVASESGRPWCAHSTASVRAKDENTNVLRCHEHRRYETPLRSSSTR